MDNNTTSAGIEPGGLRSSSDIKLLVCYILKAINKPISTDNLAKIIAEDGLANYFEVTTSIKELIDNGNIIFDENKELVLTFSGSEISKTLEAVLPFTVREKAVKSAMMLVSKVKREKENKVLIEKSEKGYTVSLSIMDNDLELMCIKLLLSDSLQAEMVKEQFLKDPTTVYKSAISTLVGNDNI